MRDFLGHLSWSFFGGIISAGVMFALNILAGRWLGPEEYGKYGLVIAISSIFIIPMTMGIDTALVYHVAKSGSEFEKKENVKSSLWVVLALIASTVLLVFYFFGFVTSVFGTENSIITTAIIFSIFVASRNLFDSVIKGFHLFRYQSVVRVVESVIIFGTFFLFVGLYDFFTFKAYIGAMLIGYAFVNMVVFFKVRGVLGFSVKHTKEIISYGSYAILGSLFGVMTNSLDKVLVNKYIGPEQLGIYSAYMTVSFLLVSQIMTLFINVFFPFLASVENSRTILKKINRLAKVFFVPVFILLCFTIWITIGLFGKSYGLNWILVGEFGFLGIITMYFTVLWWLIASRGKTGMRFTSLNGIIAGMIFLSLMFIFGNILTLYYVVLFMIISIFYAIIIGNLKYAKIK